MNQPTDKILSVLDPPPGGLARLLSRRDSLVRRAPPWWALAAGAATAVVWMAVLSGRTEIRMQLTGARLIGERSQGLGVQMLDGSRAVPLSSDAADVRVYWVERADSIRSSGQ
jgi:hypothetical protein